MTAGFLNCMWGWAKFCET